MQALQNLYNSHAGETCLIIGNGPGLADIPLTFLQQYASFGSNLLYKLREFTPTYYGAVDQKVLVPRRHALNNYYKNVPKFVPDRFPDYQADYVYYFHHRPGEIWQGNQDGPLMLTRPGICYVNITHVLLQIAYWMGFTTMLCVGLDNTADGAHFYGQTEPGYSALEWDKGYKILYDGFRAAKTPREIVNISTRTEAKNLPRKDWQDYAKGKVLTGVSG